MGGASYDRSMALLGAVRSRYRQRWRYPRVASMATDSQEPDTAAAVIRKALEWVGAGHSVALATVLRTWGSAPRQVGSMVAINQNGAFCGSVSGGCVEASVIQEALEVLADGAPRNFSFDVSDDTAWSVGLACGGAITVRIDPLTGSGFCWVDLYSGLLTSLDQRRDCFLITDLASGRIELHLCAESACRMLPGSDGPPSRSGIYGPDGQEKFLNLIRPPARLIILGGVHIAQMLAPMAQLSGLQPIVVERRAAFAEASRFPGVQVVVERAGDAVRALAPDARTAVVALTHNPELDDPGLISALGSSAFYVGALGSRRTQELRRARLLGCGVDAVHLDRLHAPIGLDIGASTPAEIAVSILAEIIGELRGKR